jgi:hypothetical protein
MTAKRRCLLLALSIFSLVTFLGVLSLEWPDWLLRLQRPDWLPLPSNITAVSLPEAWRDSVAFPDKWREYLGSTNEWRAYLGLEPAEEELDDDVVEEGDPALHYTQRVIAMGSLYSDYSAFTRTLRLANLIGPTGAWTGRRAVLVVCGNTLGYGRDTIVLQQRLKLLKKEAERVGGHVHLLLGKHEVWCVSSASLC